MNLCPKHVKQKDIFTFKHIGSSNIGNKTNFLQIFWLSNLFSQPADLFLDAFLTWENLPQLCYWNTTKSKIFNVWQGLDIYDNELYSFVHHCSWFLPCFEECIKYLKRILQSLLLQFLHLPLWLHTRSLEAVYGLLVIFFICHQWKTCPFITGMSKFSWQNCPA